MNFMTQVEIESLVNMDQALLGGQLQEVISNDRGLAFGIYLGRVYYLVLDIESQFPGNFLFETIPFFKKSPKPKPLELFLKSHAQNLIFTDICILKEQGRVLQMSFTNSQKKVVLKFVLVPKMTNLEVTVDILDPKKNKWIQKTMSWNKPREIGPIPEIISQEAARSESELHNIYLKTWTSEIKNQLDPKAVWEKQKEKNLAKKIKALEQIQLDFNSDKYMELMHAGERLKSQAVPEVIAHYGNFSGLLDPNLSQGLNLEKAFAKAKQLKAKKEGQKNRIEILEKEIQELRNITFEVAQRKKPSLGRKTGPVFGDLMKKTGSQGRTLKLSEGVQAYLGKTAKDNLQILRAAKSWDLWLHLRDYPGAHAIIHRDKNQNINDSDLKKVALWVADESLSNKTLALGQSLAVVIVECRFVRPIKGDKLGRVNYHSEKQISVSYQK